MSDTTPQPTGLPDLTSTPATPETATAALATLRMDRIAGRVDETHYLQRSEYLQQIISGQKTEAPKLYLTQEEQFSRQREEHMRPASPAEYRFEYAPGFSLDTDEARAFDTAVRTAFSAAGIPQHLGGPIFEAADRVSRELANASSEERQARIARTTAQLQQRWGNEFKARLDAVDEVVATITAHSPTLAEIVDEAPHVLADVGLFDFLDRVAQHRKSRRA